jgi:hypothetical protein
LSAAMVAGDRKFIIAARLFPTTRSAGEHNEEVAGGYVSWPSPSEAAAMDVLMLARTVIPVSICY